MEIPKDAALLLVDVQNDFCPGGALAVPDGDRVIPVLNRLTAAFVARGRPVYASRDWHPPDTTHFRDYGGPWPPHCIAGTAGAAFHPDLRVPPDVIVISKGQDRRDDGYSAFEGTTPEDRTLAEDLRARRVTALYVGGLATDYCVRATVLDARRAGLAVSVFTDGSAGIDPAGSQRALQEMKAAGATLRTSRPERSVHMQQELVRMVAEKTGLPEDKAHAAAETVIDYLKGKLPAGIASQVDSIATGESPGALGSMAADLRGKFRGEE